MASEIRVNKIQNRSGLSTVTFSDTGAIVSGIVTANNFSGSGASLTNIPSTQLTGALPALDGSNLTGITQTTINNNGSNRIITGSGTANTLEGESTFTYDGVNKAKIDTSQTYGMLQLDGSSGGAIEFYENGTRRFEIYGIDAGIEIYDRDKGAYHSKFLSGGDLEISDGNLKFASGHGIDFSATGNISGTSSELLKDYEEGSWTPVVGGWDTFTPYSGSSYYAGWYVKVGAFVHCGWKIYIQNLTTVSSSAHIRITGLPFASKTVSAGPVAAPVRFDIPEFGMSGYNLTYLAGNDTVLYMYKHVNGGGHLVAINATANRSNLWTMGTVNYQTDA